uniref:Centrin 3 n=1 Tax=Echinococcus granulosus TaxID=6210 RepID=A0A068WZN2_ECHGR|nr:centrin 3 [Echinococcus granulosus]
MSGNTVLKPAMSNLSPAQMQEISEAFALFDNDKDNRLSPYEFKVALVALGFELKPTEISELLQSVDLTADDKIAFRDFFSIVKKLIQERDPITEIVQAFKLFDEESSGKISYRTLKKIAKELGENLSDDELHVMIDEFDRDGDRSISLEEFMNILSE